MLRVVAQAIVCWLRLPGMPAPSHAMWSCHVKGTQDAADLTTMGLLLLSGPASQRVAVSATTASVCGICCSLRVLQ